MLLRGFVLTLGIASASLLIGFVMAVPVGLLLNTKRGIWRIPHLIVRTIVDFLRGTPVLIQLFFVWMGLGFAPIVAAVVTLGINCMAYMAEVVRSGLIGVDRGQIRAAQALGLSRSQAFFHVVWPQAFRIAIPPLMNSVVALTKDTALVAVISIPEVLSQAQAIISITYQPRLYYFMVAVMFFVVTFPLMKMAGVLEARIKQKGFSND
jgi:glutamine transport system permease protein